MNMEGENIPDYNLDEGCLKEIMFEMLEKPLTNDLTVKLPVTVQVIHTSPYLLADGEFKNSRCAFTSQQPRPECFSILKIKKISQLPMDKRGGVYYYRFGEIEFDTVVSGEEIGFSLYQDLKDINMKELMKRKQEIGVTDLKKSFKAPKLVGIMKHMWENRSEKVCDVKFTFETDEEAIVYANKNVLVAASEVFKVHFDNEGFVDDKVVNIVDASLYSFNKLLEFIYTGKVQFTTWKLVFDLLYLSKKYLLFDLEELCQNAVIEFCNYNREKGNYDSENLLKVFEQNKKVNDERIHEEVELGVIHAIYKVINSKAFLNCDFSTVEWIMSLNDLEIDEWSRLCALYKWALFQRMENETDEPRDCFRALLEGVRYENIDGLNLQRFLKLSKLPEIIDVNELKQGIFDSLLDDGSYLDIGTNFPKCRSDSSFCVEIEIGYSDEKEMKNIHVTKNGPVLGFKIKQEYLNIEAHSLDLVLSFRYLYSKDEKKEAELRLKVDTVKTKSRISEGGENDDYFEENYTLTHEWNEFTLYFQDYRRYLFDKIEDFGLSSGGANKHKILTLLMDFELVT